MHPVLQFLQQAFGNVGKAAGNVGNDIKNVVAPPPKNLQGNQIYGGPDPRLMMPHIANMMNSYNHLAAMMPAQKLPEAPVGVPAGYVPQGPPIQPYPRIQPQLQMGVANSAPVQNWQQAGFQPPTSSPAGAVGSWPVRGQNLQAPQNLGIQQ